MAQSDRPERKWDFDRVFRLLLTVLTGLGLFILVRYLSDVLIPFVVALLLAFLLNPIVSALESRIHRRAPAVLITVIGTGIVTFAAVLMLVSVGSRELSSVRQLLRGFVPKPTTANVREGWHAFDTYVNEQENPIVKEVLTQLRDRLTTSRPRDREVMEKLDDLIDRQVDPTDRAELVKFRKFVHERLPDEFDIAGLARKAVRLVAPSLVGFFTGTLSFILGLTGFVVILLYLVFLLIDYPVLVKTWRGFLPPAYREDIVGFLEDFRLAMSRYFRGQFIIAMTVGILLAIGFKIIGLRMAILLGLGVGTLNMVPYLQTVGLIPALILGMMHGLETSGSPWMSMLLVLVVFAVVQATQDWVLTPRIMGKTVGLRPVVLLLGLFIWGKLLGFLGLVLAIPLTCLGLAYYKRYVLGDKTAQPIKSG